MSNSVLSRKFLISGMTCGHCRSAVESAIREVPGATSVCVDLERGIATVDGHVSPEAVQHAVEEAGYEATPATNE